MDETLEKLRDLLNKKARMSDDMIARRIPLTAAGYRKLANIFRTTEEGVKKLMARLADEIEKETLTEADENDRYYFETDFSGNIISLRDSRTGSQKIIQGWEAQELLAEIDRVYPDYQGVIAPYFTHEPVMEFAEVDPIESIEAEIENGGTYNFPYRGKFATARFWTENGQFHVEVVSLRNREGDEYPITDKMREDLKQQAFKWIDKV